MARFRGRYDYTVDHKGRFNIPAKWRKLLSPEADETFVVCRAPGGCLRAYPQDEWERFAARMESTPGDRDMDRVLRTMANTMTDSVLDRQGRITMSGRQMEMAGISRNVALIGRSTYVEVWDPERFEQHIGPADDFDDMYYTATSKL
jgi:MraZ protein